MYSIIQNLRLCFQFEEWRSCTTPPISLQGELGEGEFGKVKKGVWLGPEFTDREVAAKVLKDESEKVRLLQEAAIMGQFAHPNIVQLYGLTTITEPVSVYGVSCWEKLVLEWI